MVAQSAGDRRTLPPIVGAVDGVAHAVTVGGVGGARVAHAALLRVVGVALDVLDEAAVVRASRLAARRVARDARARRQVEHAGEEAAVCVGEEEKM